MSERIVPRDLGGGLALRWATAADGERVAELNARVFRHAPDDPPSPGMLAQTRDKMSGRSPLLGPEDFAIVEDTRRGAVVAGACLMRQRWEYDGIPFDVGRPELVATDPDYRNRGLVRAIFAALHARSAEWGQPVQGITGIPYFYRQFGYEYALDLDAARSAYLATIPDALAGAPEPYTLRDATPDDLPFITALYDRRRAGLLVSAAIPEDFWRSTFGALDLDYTVHWRLRLVLDRAGAARGYVRTSTRRWGNTLPVWDLALADGVPPRAAGLAVLRALREVGARLPAGRDPQPLGEIALLLGREHPLYAALGEAVLPRRQRPYAWYVRVPDLPGFLRRLAPALERRLAGSALAGHSGELHLDFYRDGLRLVFAAGRLAAAEPWRRPARGERAGAGFPPLVFLQLLFGHRDLAELRDAFPDVRADDESAALLDILFPKRPSWVIYLE